MSSEDFSMLNSALTPVVECDTGQVSIAVHADWLAVFIVVIAGLGGAGRCCCDPPVANQFGQIKQRPAAAVFFSKPRHAC